MSTNDNEWRTQLGNWYYNPGYDGVGFSELKALARRMITACWSGLSRAVR